jgi:hypothetical protein
VPHPPREGGAVLDWRYGRSFGAGVWFGVSCDEESCPQQEALVGLTGPTRAPGNCTVRRRARPFLTAAVMTALAISLVAAVCIRQNDHARFQGANRLLSNAVSNPRSP